MEKSVATNLALIGGAAVLCCAVACTPPPSSGLSLDDVPAGAEPITTFNGEWLSDVFGFAFRITNRVGISTLPSSNATEKGDVVLVITGVDGIKFDGMQVFSDGSVQDVIGRLVGPDTLSMVGAGTSWIMVRISTPNAPPTVSAGDDQTVCSEPGSVELVGTADDDGEPDDALTTEWTLLSGPGEVEFEDAAALDTTATFSAAGEYELQLEAGDTELTASDTVVITIQENTPPTADAGDDRNVVAGLTVTLRGSGSSDPCVDALTFSWTQTGGVAVALSDPTEAQPTFIVPDDAESLSFALTVDDGQAGVASASVTLTVVANPTVRMDTSKGEVVIELLIDEAPAASLNFLQYVEDGFYDGTVFHRVVPDFVVQGGGFLPGGVAQTGLRDPIVNEFSPDRSNLRGTVAAAKVGDDPDSATSQFFFNLADNSENLDNQNGGFTVFAHVADGMDVVDSIATVALNGEIPVEDIILTQATIE